MEANVAIQKNNTSPTFAQPERVTRVALYARVSTLNGQNPEMQLLELVEYADRRGWQIASEYVDRMSGKSEHRPELDRLWGDCRKRKVDAVVVYRPPPVGERDRKSVV